MAYNPKEVTVILGSKILSGFGPDSLVKVELDEDEQILHMGADGQGARTVNANGSATIEIPLMSTSEDNSYLNDLADSKSATAFAVKDGSGDDLATAINVFVQKRPAMEKGKEVVTNTWILRTPAAVIQHGGSSDF